MENLDAFLANQRENLKAFLEINQSRMEDFKEKLKSYNAHKIHVSKPFQEKMEKIKLSYSLVNNLAQATFVLGYSALFLKWTVFKHYNGLNLPIKLGLISLYFYSVEPLTLGTCKNVN